MPLGRDRKWLQMGNKAAINRLGEESGGKVVAKAATGTPALTEVPVNNGGPSRTRTLDPLIKRRGPVMSRPSSFFAHLRVTARSA